MAYRMTRPRAQNSDPRDPLMSAMGATRREGRAWYAVEVLLCAALVEYVMGRPAELSQVPRKDTVVAR